MRIFLITLVPAMLFGYIAAQQSVQLTAVGVGVLSFCAGYIVSYLIWVTHIGGN